MKGKVIILNWMILKRTLRTISLEIYQLKKTVNRLRAERNGLRKESGEVQEVIDGVKMEKEAFKAERDEWRKKFEELESVIEGYEVEKDMLEDKLDEAGKQLGEAESKMREFRKKT